VAAWEDMIDEVREYPTPSQDLRHSYSLSVTSDSTENTLNLHGCSESQKSCTVSKCQDQRMTPLAEGPVRNVALLAPGADVDTARPTDRGERAGNAAKTGLRLTSAPPQQLRHLPSSFRPGTARFLANSLVHSSGRIRTLRRNRLRPTDQR